MDYVRRTHYGIRTSTTQATAFAKDCSQPFITETAISSLAFVHIVTAIKTI